MLLKAIYTFRCDGCGITQDFLVDSINAGDVEYRLEDDAKWFIVYGFEGDKHYCKDCKKKYKWGRGTPRRRKR